MVKKTGISLGIVTCRDRDNLPKLIRSISAQKLKSVRIAEIIIVAPEGDQPAIRKAIRNRKNMLLLDEGKRKGKYAAVNIFLRKAKSGILALCSGDVILEEHALEKLCAPLKDKTIGVVASRPKPLPEKKPTLLGSSVEMLWELRHALSDSKPKYGELLAFRNLHITIPKTAVDEEMIVSAILSEGYSGAYAPDAIVYNNGPKNAKDFIRQRRRIYCGHLALKKGEGYEVPTLNTFKIVAKGIVLGAKERKILPALAYGALLEGISRLLGTVDFLRNVDHSRWKIIDKD